MLKKIIVMLFPFASFLLIGCTDYHAMDWTGQGYQDFALNPGMYEVSFIGSEGTNKTSVESYLLRRCAELTLSNGYRYFLVEKSNTTIQGRVVSTPETVDVQRYDERRNQNQNPWEDHFAGDDEFQGGSDWSRKKRIHESHERITVNPASQRLINHFEAHAIIRMIDASQGIPADAFDARVILKQYLKQ